MGSLEGYGCRNCSSSIEFIFIVDAVRAIPAIVNNIDIPAINHMLQAVAVKLIGIAIQPPVGADRVKSESS